MTLKPNNIPSPAADQPGRLPPVRVKLRRPDAYVSQTYAPDGESKNWWRRLKRTLGTTSSDFVNASLLQIQAAARSPFGTISETHINAALAIIEAAAPKNEIEAALAVQMACAHTAAMAVLTLLAGKTQYLWRTRQNFLSFSISEPRAVALSCITAISLSTRTPG